MEPQRHKSLDYAECLTRHFVISRGKPRRPVRRNILTTYHLAECLKWCHQNGDGHVPGRGLFCSQMSRFFCHVLMNAHVSTDVEGSVTFLTVLVVAVSWCAQESIMLDVAGILTGIRYRNEILQHHVILHMNVNGGMF